MDYTYVCLAYVLLKVPNTSSPHLPQSNGEAEATVKIAERIISQSDQFTALLNYRATPVVATGSSPAQMLMGRAIRITLPQLSSKLEPGWPDMQKVRTQDKKIKETYSRNFNERHGARVLSELQPGDNVMTKLDDQKRWSPATVIARTEEPHSYIINTKNQGDRRRNRKHIQPVPVVAPHDDVVEEPPAILPPSDVIPTPPFEPPCRHCLTIDRYLFGITCIHYLQENIMK